MNIDTEDLLQYSDVLGDLKVSCLSLIEDANPMVAVYLELFDIDISIDSYDEDTDYLSESTQILYEKLLELWNKYTIDAETNKKYKEEYLISEKEGFVAPIFDEIDDILLIFFSQYYPNTEALIISNAITINYIKEYFKKVYTYFAEPVQKSSKTGDIETTKEYDPMQAIQTLKDKMTERIKNEKSTPNLAQLDSDI